MRIYYFTQEKYALDCIFNKKLKLCLLENANDPFEYMVQSINCDMPKLTDYYSLTSGIVCFSESYNSPLMWGHYANNHTGICLCFEVKRNRLIKIQYKKKRAYSRSVLTKNIKELSIKSADWSYEKEYRINCRLAEAEQTNHEHFFVPFQYLNIELKEVILGVRNKTNINALQRTLGSKYDKKILIYGTRLSRTYFKIRKDKIKEISLMPFLESIKDK